MWLTVTLSIAIGHSMGGAGYWRSGLKPGEIVDPAGFSVV